MSDRGSLDAILLASRRWKETSGESVKSCKSSEQHSAPSQRVQRHHALGARSAGSVILLTGADGERESPDFAPLLKELGQAGFCVERHAWQESCIEDTAAAARCVLPLAVWDYSHSAESHARFVSVLRSMRERGVEPQADLSATVWCSHKSYLLELGSAGLPIVPTVLLHAGSTEADVDSAIVSLNQKQPQPPLYHQQLHWMPDTTSCGQAGAPAYTTPHASPSLLETGCAGFVMKPAIGGRGDGVERLRIPLRAYGSVTHSFHPANAKCKHDSTSSAEGWLTREHLISMVSKRDVLLQPFLPRVAVNGEICVLFVNGELRHVVHKDPSGWGYVAEDALGCIPHDGDELEPCMKPLSSKLKGKSAATNGALDASTIPIVVPGDGPLASTPSASRGGHVSGLQRQNVAHHFDLSPQPHSSGVAQPVSRIVRPPIMVVETAKQVMAHVSRRVNTGATRGGALFLCRVDFLPAIAQPSRPSRDVCEVAISDDSQPKTEQLADATRNLVGDDQPSKGPSKSAPVWLVSEVEAGWPECFFRTLPGLAASTARALRVHMRCNGYGDLE